MKKWKELIEKKLQKQQNSVAQINIDKANKDPQQLHNAQESFGQAKKMWAQNYEECT